MGVVLAIDAGTTGVRTLAFDEDGALRDSAYRELTQHYPRPGWVEHDATEIWAHVASTLREVAADASTTAGQPVAAIGLTNQRETLVAWRRSTGKPVQPGHRLAGPAVRRTSATGCARRVTRTSCGAERGSSSTPTSRPPRWRG